ncbi:MAG TPA: site-specific integrase [Acidimicrobiales bacterium]|nr:site-specific integrase [Acidimicrobiales bacterium]
MNPSALHLIPTGDDASSPDPDALWLGWLAANVEVAWRPGEWDPDLWLFTGDLASDRTAAWGCTTPGCPTATHRHDGRCDSCRRWMTAAGMTGNGVDRTPRRRVPRLLTPGVCSVLGCEGEHHSNGLCFRHERAWRRTEPLEAYLARARPLRRLEPCAVLGCGRERITRRGLCSFHTNRLRRDRDVRSLSAEQTAAWIAAAQPRLGAHQFCLGGLAELTRLELLYALQHRDRRPPPLDPTQLRILVSRLAGARSVRHADPEAVCERGGQQYNGIIRGLFRDLVGHLDRAWALHTGADPYSGDVWQVGLLGLQSNGSRRWPATLGVIDFTTIELGWLRAVIKDWAQATRPYLQRLREAIRACRAASQALVAAGRTDPARLGAGDFAIVVGALSELRRDDGALHSAAHRNLLLAVFCELIEHGRTSGLMRDVPDPFRPAKRRHRVAEDPNEDELGKALPDMVIRQLDAHLDLLGPTGRSGSVAAGDLQAMQQVIYQLLRDTGRRPGEVTSLRLGCVELIDGCHNLIYDNHKAGRMRRRLPITAATAETILAWERRRAHLGDPTATRGWLFPSPMLRSHQALGHLGPACVARAFHFWVERIGTIDGELLGPGGIPVPFDPTLIVPYAMRHSYAQRHADAGVPVDVLRELMDHRSVQTTMGYYHVSLRRKQQAIRSVGSLATDADGNPSPFASPLAYERASVSVPFGNCTEPSNVKAGGGHCPIRFQCAGCGFYRPDPSYLPALEDHVASLRADLETARAISAADYVIANLTAEIDAFGRAAEKMRRRLAELGPDERAEVDEASRLLRRARAARRIPVIAATPQQTG